MASLAIIKGDFYLLITECPAGQYRSRDDTTCQQCPANTVMTVVAAPECECLPGYFRNNENRVPPQPLLTPPNEQASSGCTSEHMLY